MSHGVPYPYSITDANDGAEFVSVMNSIFSHAGKTEGASFHRGLAASNPSGTWTVRYNYCTSHNSLKRYSCLWTLAINGVAVSLATPRLATEGTEREKTREIREQGGREREREGRTRESFAHTCACVNY